MSDAAVTITLGWVAAALGTWSAFAQYARLRRRGAQGVSLSTWTLFVALALFWVAYGVAVRSWPLATSSALALPVQAMIWWRLGPGVRRGAVARALAVALASCLAPAFLWGWAGAVVGAGVAGTVTRLPQLARLVRSSDVTGVSRGSWALGALVSAMWVAYYARSRLWAVLAVTAVAGSVSLGVAVVAAWRQRPSRAATTRSRGAARA